MKYFKPLIALAGIILISSSVPARDWDFRQVKWGMTTYDVKDREFILGQKWKFVRHTNDANFIHLLYRGELFEQSCILTYQFTNLGLISASYSFTDLDKIILPGLVKTIKTVLDKKYIESNLFDLKDPNWVSKDKRTFIKLSYKSIDRTLHVMYTSLNWLNRAEGRPIIKNKEVTDTDNF